MYPIVKSDINLLTQLYADWEIFTVNYFLSMRPPIKIEHAKILIKNCTHINTP